MNQKGFATIFGLVLILAIALVVRGIQESNANYNYETANLEKEIKTEMYLQSVAEVGIYMATEELKKNSKEFSGIKTTIDSIDVEVVHQLTNGIYYLQSDATDADGNIRQVYAAFKDGTLYFKE